MVKSVDKIVKGLSKLVTQLEDCVAKCYNEDTVQQGIISVAKTKQNDARFESERAQRICTKLKGLIE